MGTLAEAAIVDYILSFANQQIPISVFCLQQTNGSCYLLLVLFKYGKQNYNDIYTAVFNGKTETLNSFTL
jgi:hypothetical protein